MGARKASETDSVYVVYLAGIGARRPPKLTQKYGVGEEQGIQVSISLVCQRNTVQVDQDFQGQGPVRPTQSEAWFSVRGPGAL